MQMLIVRVRVGVLFPTTKSRILEWLIKVVSLGISQFSRFFFCCHIVVFKAFIYFHKCGYHNLNINTITTITIKAVRNPILK